MDNIKALVAQALKEDLGQGDITTQATISQQAKGRARIISKAAGVIAGTQAAAQVFRTLDRRAKVMVHIPDGKKVNKNDVVMEIKGSMAVILSGERIALNFLQRLSGIATLTRAYVDELKGLKTKILDTRKTTPGMRRLEKYAVSMGGGTNHRTGLYDMFLIKDNHIDAAGGIKPALKKVQAWKKEHRNNCRVEIETRTLAEVRQALELKPDRIMLDNMTLRTMRQTVKLIRSCRRSIQIEASGNMSLARVRRVAGTGVDFISVGALTHSAPALDVSLLVITTGK